MPEEYKKIKINLPDRLIIYAESYDRAKKTKQKVRTVYQDMKRYCREWGVRKFDELRKKKIPDCYIRMTIIKLDNTRFEITLKDTRKSND